MPSKPAVEVNNLSKSFKIYRRSRDRLAQLFISKPLHRDFKALDNISFSLQRGEFLGIVGENGSGKSTLLKLVAGILLPDAGSIERGGKITGLLELGTGFNVELSGRQNIYLNGVYLNMDKTLLAEREQQIIDFAELGEFIDEPLKNYSSGMTMRLGFAIGIHADPLCFIIDEALSVGDARFQQKCFARLREFKTGGGSVLFVSHDMNAVKLLCDRALVLNHGAARHLGSPDEAVNIYNELMAAKGRSGKTEAAGYGNGDVFFTSAQILGADGTPVAGITSGAPCSVRFAYSCRRPVHNLTFGIMIRDRFGQDIFGTNGALLHTVAHVDSDGSGQFDFPAMNLGRGMYTISLSAHTGLTHLENCFHWWDNAGAFEILDDSNYIFSGIARLEASLHLDENCRARQQ